MKGWLTLRKQKEDIKELRKLFNDLAYVVTQQQQARLEELSKQIATLSDMRENVNEIIKNTSILVQRFEEKDEAGQEHTEQYIS